MRGQLRHLPAYDLDFDPTHSGGNDNAIATETLGNWGGLNISGVPLQIAGSRYFF